MAMSRAYIIGYAKVLIREGINPEEAVRRAQEAWVKDQEAEKKVQEILDHARS